MDLLSASALDDRALTAAAETSPLHSICQSVMASGSLSTDRRGLVWTNVSPGLSMCDDLDFKAQSTACAEAQVVICASASSHVRRDSISRWHVKLGKDVASWPPSSCLLGSVAATRSADTSLTSTADHEKDPELHRSWRPSSNLVSCSKEAECRWCQFTQKAPRSREKVLGRLRVISSQAAVTFLMWLWFYGSSRDRLRACGVS